MRPYEIIMSPYEVWIAPEGTAFPDVDETPAGLWARLGTNGKSNYSEDGMTITHEQTITAHRTLGSSGPVKAVRTSESLMISLTLEDMTAEQYAKVMNNVPVSLVAAGVGTPGNKNITLRQGLNVACFALLVKGPSAYGDNWNSQYQIPRAFQNGSPAPSFNKGDAAGLACEFVALENLDAPTEEQRFGKLVIQTADALP